MTPEIASPTRHNMPRSPARARLVADGHRLIVHLPLPLLAELKRLTAERCAASAGRGPLSVSAVVRALITDAVTRAARRRTAR